jgi:hypothetical protein
VLLHPRACEYSRCEYLRRSNRDYYYHAVTVKGRDTAPICGHYTLEGEQGVVPVSGDASHQTLPSGKKMLPFDNVSCAVCIVFE